MEETRVLSAVGGDERQIYISKLFKENGMKIKNYGVTGAEDSCESLDEALSGADFLLLPVPVSKDGYRLNCAREILLMELTDKIPCKCTVFAGKMPSFLKDHLELKNIKFFDYYDDKEYIWRNAEISAEGAISMLMSEVDTALDELKILICGYGRIGKCLAMKLSALGAFVTVAARKRDEVLQAHFCVNANTDVIDYTREGIFDVSRSYDVIFNTVPSWIFDESNAELLKRAYYFEVASSPYGGELEFLKRNCKKFVFASGIPGKYASKSAGIAAYKAIFSYLEKEDSI